MVTVTEGATGCWLLSFVLATVLPALNVVIPTSQWQPWEANHCYPYSINGDTWSWAQERTNQCKWSAYSSDCQVSVLPPESATHTQARCYWISSRHSSEPVYYTPRGEETAERPEECKCMHACVSLSLCVCVRRLSPRHSMENILEEKIILAQLLLN